MMQLADRGALVQDVDHQFVLREQSRFKLLLGLVICPDGGDEGTGCYPRLPDERLLRWGTSDAYIAVADGGLQLTDRYYLELEFRGQFARERRGPFAVNIEGKYCLKRK